MADIFIRPAQAADAEAIARIYNHYVTESCATFDTVVKTAEDRRRWLSERGPMHPVFVAEDAGDIVGWGALSAWSQRPAWARTVEVAVYLDCERTGSGLGPQLLDALITEGRRVGHHALVAQIVADNAASLVMVSRAGFEMVGTLREVGRKFDRWHDVALVELLIAEE